MFVEDYTCPADMVKCKDNLQCVSKDHFMSGYEECHDYSDEDLEYAKFILKDEFEYTTTLIYWFTYVLLLKCNLISYSMHEFNYSQGAFKGLWCTFLL